MKTSLFKILLPFVAFVALSCEEPRFVVGTRISAPIYSRPLAPGDSYIWIDGEWFWNGSNYAWRNGYWALPSRGYRWSPGHWAPRRHGYQWKPGRWR